MDGKSGVLSLAGWVTAARSVPLPEDVKRIARNCLVDTFGVAVAGSRTPMARAARVVVSTTAAAGAAEILGSHLRLTPAAAALTNACAAHALDFDDNCYAGVVHGSAVIAPASLAMAQALNASGDDLLRAFIIGSEVEYAVGEAATAVLYEQGWWTTSVLGPIGASAAAAVLLGLDEERVSHALGIAIAGTGGQKACFGTDAKPWLAGRAAEAGIMAALIAAAGITGPACIFEHRAGFSALFSAGNFDPEPISSMGRRWKLITPGIDVKRIPVCLASHAAVDAVCELVADSSLRCSDIDKIVCDVPPRVVASLTYDRPTTAQQAQFSMPFAIAASLIYGTIKLEHLCRSVIDDPGMQELMPRVEMCSGSHWSDPEAQARAPEGAIVQIATRAGKSVERYRAFPRGSAAEPMSAAEIHEKFMSCSSGVLGLDRAIEQLALLAAIDTLPSVRTINLSGADD